MKTIFPAVLLTGFLTGQTLAQETDNALVLGEILSVQSSILDETRQLWVATPPGYEESDEHYPVLYLLDGESSFRHTSASAEFLAQANRIPGLIVVGILSTDRARDFTPPSDAPDDHAGFPTHGGADRFQAFLETELFPAVESEYRTRPFKLLVGHSLGGLFAIHTLITQPELFDAYIAISPSLQWSNQGLVEQAQRFLHGTEELQADLYMTAANEGGALLAALRKLSGVLGEDTPRGLRWQFKHMPGEHHGTVPLRSTYDGLEAVFAGWSFENARKLFDIGGLEAVRRTYRNGGQRFGYDRSLSPLSILQLASELIQLNRLDEATVLVTEDLGAVPPSYFLNLLADRYLENGNSTRAQELYITSLTHNPSDGVARNRLEAMGVDTVTLVPEISLSEATLGNYVGEYQLQPGFTLTVYIEYGTLYSRGTGQPAVELVPLSESHFSVTGGDAQIVFIAESGDQADRLVLVQFGMEMEAPRIDQEERAHQIR